MKRDDYVLGGHHFWIHFGCGLIFGVGLGAWISWGLCDGLWMFIALTAIVAVAVALACGYWGDSAWEWVVELFGWFS